MATATPNNLICGLADKYNISLFVNEDPPGIASDWNFAMAAAHTPLVTIAHQDDIYMANYTKNMLIAVNSVKNPLLYFTDYGELRNNQVSENNRLLAVKRFMLSPLKLRIFANSRFVRRRILSFGSAICCPSVTMVLPELPMPLFDTTFSCDLDWHAWEKVSKLKGAFLYDPEILPGG